MEYQDKASIIYRLMSNYAYVFVRDVEYVLRSPTVDDLYQSSRIYQKALRDNKYSEWLTNLKCQNLLSAKGIWSKIDQEELDDSEKDLEDLKIDLYKCSLFKTSQIPNLKKRIGNLKDSINVLYSRKHALDSNTIEGYAQVVSQQHLVKSCVFHLDGKVVEDISDAKLTSFINRAAENRLSEVEVRELSRTEPWRSYWTIGKPNPFDCKFIELNDDQRSLILYSRMYDNIYENPDCPSEGVIEDNDMLDGWMIQQRRDREKSQQESEIESVIGNKHEGATDVFIPVSNAEEASKINKLNSVHNQVIKKQRQKVIEQRGEVKEGEFPDQLIGKQGRQNEMFKKNNNK
jgi:hypothetical protein